MKYIIFEVVQGGRMLELPVVFPNCINHDTMLRAIQNSTYEDMNGGVVGKAVSAGFCDMHTLSCNSKSETLQMPSRESDALVVAMCDTFAYMPLVDILETTPWGLIETIEQRLKPKD